MRSVSPRFFVDTNIIAYAYDQSDDVRRVRAQDLLASLHNSGTAAISTQVLGELYNTMIRPRKLNLPREVAEASVLNYLRSWLVLDVRPLNVIEALRGVSQHRFSYWDALIWATARLNGIPFVLSEDGQDGAYIEGVRTMNPLKPEFDLSLVR